MYGLTQYKNRCNTTATTVTSLGRGESTQPLVIIDIIDLQNFTDRKNLYSKSLCMVIK